MSNVVGGHHLSLTSSVEMTIARMIGSSAYQEMIEEMDRELINIIEDLDHAVNVEVLRMANKTSKLSFSQLLIFYPQTFGVEQEQAEQEQVEPEQVELRRFKPVETGYHRKFRCMNGT